MTSNYALMVTNLICIDLLNTSKEDLNNYYMIANTPKVLQLYISFLQKQLHSDTDTTAHPELIYIENNYIIGTRRHADDCFSMELGHLEILPDSAIDKMDASIFPLLENQLALDKNLQLSKSLEFIFKNHIKDLLIDQKYTTLFIDAHVQVSTVLAVSYAELCDNYDVAIAFLDCVNPIDTKQLKLYKIYYKNQLPIIFVFITNDGLHCMGWNAEYLKVLHAVTPIDPGKIDKKATLNLLLEKIHSNGIAILTPDEITFLDSYFQS